MAEVDRCAFVAGATGYTGRAVVAHLRQLGHGVVAHVRPDSTRLDHWRQHFEALGATVDTTRWQAEAMAQTLATHKPQVVFALLGTTAARQRRCRTAGGDATTTSYEAVDYGLTLRLLEAAEACGSQPRFVYLSSAGVGPAAVGSYLRVRWRLERRLHDSPLPWVIARPAFITGPDREEDRLGERLGSGFTDACLSALAALGIRRPQRRFASMNGATLARALTHYAFAPHSFGPHSFGPHSEGAVIDAEALRSAAEA